MYNESDTRSKLIDPKLKEVGWKENQIQREYKVTDGRIQFDGKKGVRGKPQYADYLLRYKSSVRLAVVEAKKEELSHLEGLSQAKDYAKKMGVRFAYTTNGHEIEFIDLKHDTQETVDSFHSPEQLWSMYKDELPMVESEWLKALLQDYYEETGIGQKRSPRYYQEKAVTSIIEAVLAGQKKVLVNMATGTGKTFTSVQTIYKLRESGVVNRTLFIVDRNILADQAFKDFDMVFEKDACWRLKPSEKNFRKGRSIYFGIYQTLVGTEDEDGNPNPNGKKDRFKEFPPDFFDLIVIDECHRGGANEEGNWFRLLKYFEAAIQVGLTATPKRTDSVDTYAYFGEPVMTYSLKEGINDGYLSPYVIRRVRSDIDTFGFQPNGVIIDKYGNEITEKNFEMKDFERKLSFPERTRFYAKHLVNHLYRTDIFGKTIVFCVDQRHAADMAKYANEAYKALAREKGLDDLADFCLRITSNDKSQNGRYLDLERFEDLENPLPVVVTTSKLLTTGVDIKTIKNIVIFTQIGSMSEFKQIIGRGTRVYDTGNEHTEKLGFTILEYGNTSTSLFYDPEFDGEPEQVDDEEKEKKKKKKDDEDIDTGTEEDDEDVAKRIRYRLSDDFMRDQVKSSMEVLNLLDDDGETLSPSEFIQYQSDKIKTVYSDAEAFKQAWENPVTRKQIFAKVEEMGIQVDTLAELFCIEKDRKDVDLYDIILNLAFGCQFKSKDERIKEFKKKHKEFFTQYREQALEVLETILDIYQEEEYLPLKINADTFKTNKFRDLNISSMSDVQGIFSSREEMISAFKFVQTHLYEGELIR